MDSERISLTCAPGGENHRGNQLIGEEPIKGRGLTQRDIEDGLFPYFESIMGEGAKCLNLNELSGENSIKGLKMQNQARVLHLKKWVQTMFGNESTKDIYDSLKDEKWDSKYLDKKKDKRDENGNKIIGENGKPVKGRVMNKHARHNICLQKGVEQLANYEVGNGTILDLNKKQHLMKAVDLLVKQIREGLKRIDSKTRVVVNVVEGNRYYNPKKTGISFHGDTERVIVICISIGGGESYPMKWQWFYKGFPAGNSIDISISDGDVYIMSEKAVGTDWLRRNEYTLRHAAGAEKFTSLKKWIKRMLEKQK
jgi:hypothetical protein